MGYKLKEQDCHNIIKDDVEHVHEKKLEELYVELTMATEIHTIYRLQGRIVQIKDEMSLKDKAFKQVN